MKHANTKPSLSSKARSLVTREPQARSLAFLKRFHKVNKACKLGVLAALLGASSTWASAQDATCLGDSQASQHYAVSVVPQFPAAELFAAWSPVLTAIGKQQGWCFTMSLQHSIPEFEASLLAGQPDFAFANPYHFLMAQKAQGYHALIADHKALSGILVVRKDSKLQSLSDLNHAELALPAPNAFAASLITRALLAKQGIQVQPKYVKTHTNVYRSVFLGDVPVGGGVNKTLSKEPAELQQQLRVLFETPGYPSHPIIAHPRIPLAFQKQFQTSFMALTKQANTQELLQATPVPKPKIVTDDDYQGLAQLGLEKFVKRNKP